MKKSNIKTKWLFMVCLLLVFCLGQVFGATCGDINTSGTVDIVDALSIAQFSVGLNPLNFDSTVADVNADSVINIVDALLVAQFYVGLIPQLSCTIPTTEPMIYNGGPFTLNGTSDFADLPDGITSNLTDFSITGWVNLNSVPNWVRIFDFGVSTDVFMMMTPKSADTGFPYFCITLGGTTGEQGINGTSALATGLWQHFAIVKSGTTGIMYINKIEVGRNTGMALNPSDLGNTTNNYIGRSQWTNDPYLSGNVDKFYIYNRALSVAEVTTLGNNPPPTITASPTAVPTPTPIGGETSMKNPLIWADAPDPSVIRVGNDFYMTSTSMHMMPGIPIMHSTDLVNWEIISYVYQTMENNNAHNLVSGNIYGKGSWATNLRYNNNTFYVCFNSNDMGRTYVYKTTDIRGTWTRSVLSGSYHDPSLLFDDDGRVYIIYGAGDIRIVELTADATAVKSGGVNQIIFSTPSGNIVSCEGSHAYKINGMYYVFLIRWPSGGKRLEMCYRSSNLLSGYQSQVLLDDDLGYNNKGVAQGGIVSLPDGKWYGMLFQDHDSVGRIPVLVPVTWTNNWPVMGVNGKAPATMTIPLAPSGKKTALLTSDEFTQTQLGLNWQWNHNPNNSAWSLTQRSGYLRLVTANTVSNILQARNTVSQRTVGPTCTGEVVMQTENMKNGDYAGIAAFQNTYGFIGVKKNSSGQRYIVMATNGGSGNPSEGGSVALNQDKVYLRIRFDFTNSTDKANFYYSLDGSSWLSLGGQLQMKYTLDHFMGYRIALFNYATSTTGGSVDFDYFHATTPN